MMIVNDVGFNKSREWLRQFCYFLKFEPHTSTGKGCFDPLIDRRKC